MVGKPNISKNATQGAAMTTPGLNALDQEREASMADEGGAAGARMEEQPVQSIRIDATDSPRSNQPNMHEQQALKGSGTAEDKESEGGFDRLPLPYVTLRQHNVMDYVHGATVAAAPWMFRFSDIKPASLVFTALGTGTIGYSLFTRYPYSIAKVIPLGVHMSMDVASGAALMAAPYVFGYRHRLNRFQLGLHFMLGLGAFALVALTRPKTEKQKLDQWAEQLEGKFKLAA